MSELAVAGGVRVLGAPDLADVVRVVSTDPVANVFVASRVRSAGVDPVNLGCPLWGYVRDGRLRSLCHAGSNLVPVEADDAALDAFAEFAGPRRTSSSILGPAHQALGLWERLTERWGGRWSEVREVRRCQPVMSIATEPAITGDPMVRRVTLEHWDSYFQAAVKMYTEEVGVSPVQGNPAGYRYYVRQLITSGRAYAAFDGPRVIFKADLGSVSALVSQVQGVWLEPSLRGRGLAPAMMAAVVSLARSLAPTVSLYVNDFNRPARATYARIGMREVGMFATVLY